MTPNFNPIIHVYKTTILILLASNSLLKILFSQYRNAWTAKLGIACLVATDFLKATRKQNNTLSNSRIKDD